MSVRYLATASMVVFATTSAAQAIDLFSENFDVDHTAHWTVNDGPTDEHAEFFFDYGNVGVPPAPNSGGTTRGMRLRANLYNGIFAGFSVSPTGKSFTGDYRVTFDLWHNYIGSASGGVGVIGSTPGSTMLSLFGIQTSGMFANYPGEVDAIVFAAAGDISSSAFRAISPERDISYQLPHFNPHIDIDDLGNPIDSHATYHANTRSNNPASGNGNDVYYRNIFPSVTVPAAQTSFFPDTQHGATVAGSVGFAWHQVEIAKVGSTVTWHINGVPIITLVTANMVLPTAGTNILFGHADVNESISNHSYYPHVAFTLIDNIKVSTITPSVAADYNGDGRVDAADYVVWRKGGPLQNEIATPDIVDSADYTAWFERYGETFIEAGSGNAVPEPNAAAFFSMILACFLLLNRPAIAARAAKSEV